MSLNMNSPPTIVTGFLANMNQRPDRPAEVYLELGKELLSIKVPKIVFMDAEYMDRFTPNEHTFMVPLTRADIELLECAPG
jgi:hypothetical protein